MMNVDLPPQQNGAPTTLVGQYSNLNLDESSLSSSDLSDYFKAVILRHRIEQAIKKNNAEGILTGVQIMDLQTGQMLSKHNQETEHFAASINKIPVSLLVLEDLRAGDLDLDQVMTWLPSDVRGGFGLYDQPGAPLQATLGEVISDLLNRSGNTAVRILVNGALGGSAAVNNRWAQEPELSHTYLIPLDANRFFLGNSTPSDSLWAMRQLLNTSDGFSDFMKNALATNIFTDFGVRSQLAGNDYVVLANKIGLLDDVDGNNRHDLGVIYNTKTHKSYAYSFMTTSPFDSPTATPRADESLMDMGRVLLRFAGDKNKKSDQPSIHSLKKPEAGRILY